jgi:hypothetical protein
MTANVGTDMLDQAFRRVRDLDLSLQEQLRTLAETLGRNVLNLMPQWIDS